MVKLGGWVASVFLHAAPLGAILIFGASIRSQAPVVAVSIPPSTPVSVEVQTTNLAPEFEVAPEEPRPFEVTEVPLEFDAELDTVAAEAEASPVRRSPVSVPRFDRPVPESVAVQKVAASESVPEVLTETVAVDVYNPPPEYPAMMRRRRIEGSVLVEVTILVDGTCGGAKVIEAASHEAFARAALDSVRQWKFQPATRGGKPVESRQHIRFTFKLQS